jgi:hypothetical protein
MDENIQQQDPTLVPAFQVKWTHLMLIGRFPFSARPARLPQARLPPLRHYARRPLPTKAITCA